MLRPYQVAQAAHCQSGDWRSHATIWRRLETALPLRSGQARDARLEIVEGEAEAFGEFHFGLPVEDAAGLGDVGAALLGIVLRERMEDNGDDCLFFARFFQAP